jgi:hypothetical protein
MAQVTGGTKWQPRIADTGAEWLVAYRCPTCRRPQAVHVQPGGWQAPVVADDEDATGAAPNNDVPEGSEGRLNRELAVRRWETRRRAGDVEHETLPDFTTQLWCHQCQKGSDITLSGH